MPARSQTSLGILAGGRATRLGGRDKAMATWGGQALLDRTLEAAGIGFAEVLLSYNGADERVLLNPRWRSLPDRRAGWLGPLAGLETLLANACSPWLLTLPVDLAQLQCDDLDVLLSRESGAVLLDADGLQALVALWPVARSLPVIRDSLDQGQRAVRPVLASLALERYDICPRRLGNLNAPQDFLQERLP